MLPIIESVKRAKSRILVVDHIMLLREGLCSLIRLQPDTDIVGGATLGQRDTPIVSPAPTRGGADGSARYPDVAVGSLRHRIDTSCEETVLYSPGGVQVLRNIERAELSKAGRHGE
jgi:hypothetical protein